MQEKQQSNPFSTGGGGVNFETRVQAAFAVLMLTGGFAPCLPVWPISKIKVQGKYAGYDTDDFIVFAKEPNGDRETKLLAQIKHSISITKSDSTFGEVIKAALNDFYNQQLFNPDQDAITLITGPLSIIDTENVRTILEWARHSEDANDFLTKVEMAKFSSDEKRSKLAAFRVQLNKANGTDVSDDQLWRFMKSFHLLGYDLDIKAGVTLSLLQSLIGQYSPENVQKLWLQVVDVVQSANQNAGTLDIHKFPEDVREAFRERITRTIPVGLIAKETTVKEVDLASVRYAPELAIAILLGGWNEALVGDKTVVESLSCITYAEWITKMRDILLQPGSPLIQKDNKWEIAERLKVWNALGPRLFDDHLDRFKNIVVSILRERDPKFELQPEERFAASIHGKVMSHSQSLRKGLTESLALLGSHSKVLTQCSSGKAEATAVLTVRETLTGADWMLWASLNDLLPLLAEAAPGEFLAVVENALNSDPCPFDTVFAQEGSGIMGANYMTGLIWALETLAWDSEYLIRVVVLLGELAARDPGGKWANRPVNSLTTILLPWLPQTCAPVARRKTAVETLSRELPEVAWKLLMSLLPESHQTSSGSRKPAWRDIIDEDWSKDVTHQEYWEQITIYAELAISAAKSDLAKLADLVKRLDDLPTQAHDQLLVHLGSNAIISMPEGKRFRLWTELFELVSKHRKFSDAQWAMKPEQVDRIDAVAERLAPNAPTLRHQLLFSERDFDLYEEKGSFEEQSKKLDERRQRAVKEIFEAEDVKGVLDFAKVVESPWRVGIAFGAEVGDNADRAVLPELLGTEEKSFAQFASGFVWGRFRTQGWQWVEQTDTSQWTPAQTGQLLAYLPFTPETWERVASLLREDESSYWTKANVNPYEADKGLEVAIDSLVQYGRPHAAIRCLNRMLHYKQPVDNQRAVRALLAALNSSESAHTMDVYDIVKVIKALQDDPCTNPDDLFRVEWAYLPLLDRHRGASPKLLEKRLADDPIFFCEVIRTVFRSRIEEHVTEELTEQQKNIATNAYRLLHNWRTPPGSQKDGTYNGNVMTDWLKHVKVICTESGHLEIALTMVGHVFIHTPPDSDGLWIHYSAATALNDKDAKSMRDGFGPHFLTRGVYMGSRQAEKKERLRRSIGGKLMKSSLAVTIVLLTHSGSWQPLMNATLNVKHHEFHLMTEN